MASTRGVVENLFLGRDEGKVSLLPPTGGSEVFILYEDYEVDMIDPTEMVRRNWMIGLLQQSLTRGLEVTVIFPSETDSRVEFVFLHSTVSKKPPVFKITKGTVKRIELIPEKGFVTIHGTTGFMGPEGPTTTIGSLADYDFLIYASEGAGVIRAEESNRRNRVVGLLRQALANGLDVSVTHGPEPNALIFRAILHAKEE